MSELHPSTAELAGVVLQLRDGVSFSMRRYGDQTGFLVEDEFKSKFYRIGLAEYTFVSHLDGYTTVADALGRTAVAMKDQALSESEAGALCKWLIDMQLASTVESRSVGRLRETAGRGATRRFFSRLNPITPKVPLFNPDPLLGPVAASFGWMFSLPSMLVWLSVACFGAGCVWLDWQRLTAAAPRVFASDNWLWLGLTWLLLKWVHETAHGIVCKRYGGPVREAGILFILLIPLPYVDVTSAWRFKSKWQRIHTSAAGMLAELVLAGVAAIVWSFSETGPIQQHAYNVMLSAGLMTLLFNANPLMRFDGYHILVDWLELPNLSTHGNQFLLRLGRKHVLGLPSRPLRWPERKTWLVGLYAVAAFAWRIGICVGLVLAAESLFFGAGIALAAAAVVLWVVVPAVRLLRFVMFGSETERPSRLRFVSVVGVVVAAAWMVGANVPWIASVRAPAIVDFDPIIEIRAPISGFVRHVEVVDGQEVDEGQVLMVLENRELQMQIKAITVEIRQTEQRARVFRSRHQIAAFQVEEKNLDSLEERLREKEEQFGKRVVKAPCAGRVIAPRSDSMVGVHASAGDELLTLGSRGGMRVHALVAQDDLDAFRARVGKEVRVQIWGAALGWGLLESVDPRGGTGLPHPAFSATVGGPLAVKMVPPSLGNERSAREQPLELLEPHFLARIKPLDAEKHDLMSGRPGRVSFPADRGNVGQVVRELVGKWIGRRQDRRG